VTAVFTPRVAVQHAQVGLEEDSSRRKQATFVGEVTVGLVQWLVVLLSCFGAKLFVEQTKTQEYEQTLLHSQSFQQVTQLRIHQVTQRLNLPLDVLSIKFGIKLQLVRPVLHLLGGLPIGVMDQWLHVIQTYKQNWKEVQQTDYSNNALLGVSTIMMIYWRDGNPAIFGVDQEDAGRQLLDGPVFVEGH